MKIGFVFQRDSHLKAVYATALRLVTQYKKADIKFFGIEVSIDVHIPSSFDGVRLSLAEIDQLGHCDYLVCCLGGFLLNKLIGRFQSTNTKIISIFPGVVSHYQVDAFITRFNADQVWLNCLDDYEFYARLCQTFKVKNNGLLYGASWFIATECHKSYHQDKVIFFEQTQLELDDYLTKRILAQLVSLVENYPNRLFLYKTRNNINNQYLEIIRQNLASFSNVRLVDELSDIDICQADSYISISSSAIVEGLLQGKNCYLLSRSYLDKDAAEIFGWCGMFLDEPSSLNLGWFKGRICPPKNIADLENIKKNQLTQFSTRHLSSIVLRLSKILLHYPKIWVVLLQKTKLKAIQKSLEYL